ncbi:MAG: hypothetical protein VB934_05260, partial [Polyangiaceae bacterium]
MISALAVGYGVGMTAPDTTIHDVRSAMSGAPMTSEQASPDTAKAHSWAGQGPTAVHHHYYGSMPAQVGAGALRPDGTTGSALVGNESQQLARLRARERRGTQACRLNQPSES